MKRTLILQFSTLCLIFFELWSCPLYGQASEPKDSPAEESEVRKEIAKLEGRGQILELWLNDVSVRINSITEDATQRFAEFQGQFYAALAFVTLLAFGASAQQMFAGRKGLSVLQEESDRRFQLLEGQGVRYEKFIQEQAARNKELLDTSRTNIDQITSLLGSLEQVFNFAQVADELKTELHAIKTDIDESESEEKSKIVSMARDINGEAIQISRQLNRSNYKNEEYRERIRGFRNQLNRSSLRSEWQDLLNPNVFYLLALDLIVRNLFEEGCAELDRAIVAAKATATVASADVDKVLFPEELLDSGAVAGWNRKLVNICLFHKAIVLYNLGGYTEAEALFREAVIDYDPNDAKATMYIPEAKYLAGLEGFQDVEASFRSAEQRIKAISDTRGWGQTKNSLLAQLYVRFGNIYFPSEKKRNYKQFYDLEKTVEFYGEAYRLDPDSYISKFSYGQALAAKAEASSISTEERRRCRREAERLLEEVLDLLKVRIGETTEAKILVMLYYMVAICCRSASVEHGEEMIDRYRSKMWEQTGRFASIENFRVFSPLSKSDLTVDELQDEVREVF